METTATKTHLGYTCPECGEYLDIAGGPNAHEIGYCSQHGRFEIPESDDE
jgi:hypothetical protein